MKNFLKYTIIGVLATGASTLILVILVDHLHLWVAYANLITVSLIFILKYLLYYETGMLVKQPKHSLKLI